MFRNVKMTAERVIRSEPQNGWISHGGHMFGPQEQAR